MILYCEISFNHTNNLREYITTGNYIEHRDLVMTF